MKKILAVIGSIILTTALAASASAANLLADLSYSNKYIGAAGNTIHDGEVIQGCFTLAGDNFYTFVFASQSPDGSGNNNYGDEIDIPGLGYVREFKDLGLKVDLMYAFFNLYNLRNTQGDLHQFRGTITYGPVYAIYEHNEPTDKEVLPGGNWYRIGATKEVLKNITADLSAAGHTDLLGVEGQAVSSALLGITHQAGENVKVKASYQKHFGKNIAEGGLSDDTFWLTLTYSFSNDL